MFNRRGIAVRQPLLKGIAAVGVLAVALAFGSWWQQQRLISKTSRQADDLAAGALDQSREIERLYGRPAHDLRPARRSVLRQLAKIVGELGLDRRSDIHPQARWAVARLYSAALQPSVAVHFADQLWRSGDRSPRVASVRAAVHGRLVISRLAAPRASGSFDAASFDAVVESLSSLAEAAVETGPREVTAARPSFPWLVTLEKIRSLEKDRSAAARAIGDLVEALAESTALAEPLEEQGIDVDWLRGSSDLIRARLLWPSSPDEARRSWTSAIESLNAAQLSRPSDPFVYLGLCAAWSDLLAIDFAGDPEADARGPADRAPRFSQAAVSCQDGLRVDPDSLPLKLGLTRVDLLHARWRLDRGLDARPWIADARRLNDQILEVDPEQETALADREELARLTEGETGALPGAGTDD